MRGRERIKRERYRKRESRRETVIVRQKEKESGKEAIREKKER